MQGRPAWSYWPKASQSVPLRVRILACFAGSPGTSSDFRGKQAGVRIYDRASGDWGHINIDQILLTDQPRSGTGLWRLDEYRRAARIVRRKTSPAATTAAVPGQSTKATPCRSSARKTSGTQRSSGTKRPNAGSWSFHSQCKKKIQLFGSTDLKKWTLLSEFGPAGAATKLNWECPDLFELPIEGEPGETRWVLQADMGNGAIAGGSGGEYFLGDFDGDKFVADSTSSQWFDYGRDFYAPIS